jgi:hypothetical protein
MMPQRNTNSGKQDEKNTAVILNKIVYRRRIEIPTQKDLSIIDAVD